MMDLQMPEMDGIQATRKIKQMAPHDYPLTIIAVTAFTGEEQKRKCTEVGMDGFINKPVDFRKLEQFLRSRKFIL